MFACCATELTTGGFSLPRANIGLYTYGLKTRRTCAKCVHSSSYARRNIYYLKEKDGEWRVGTILSDGSFAIINFSEDANVSAKACVRHSFVRTISTKQVFPAVDV